MMKKKQRDINIGGYHASADSIVIRTLLGSCVAVCLHDQEKKIGGMNHILFPGSADLKNYNNSARFGANAMELLINKIIRLGGRKNKLTAKIFGGGQIMPSINESIAVGPRIVSFVKEYLQVEDIKVIGGNIGGVDTRVIFFHTDTGDVYLKRTKLTMRDKLFSQEQQMINKLKIEVSKLSHIEWFR